MESLYKEEIDKIWNFFSEDKKRLLFFCSDAELFRGVKSFSTLKLGILSIIDLLSRRFL